MRALSSWAAVNLTGAVAGDPLAVTVIPEEEKSQESEEKLEKCVYEHANEDSDEPMEDEVVFDDEIPDKKNKIVKPEERITKPFLYNYERVRIIGDRTKQLALGAKPMVKNIEGLDSKEIALLELEHNVIPMIIERPLPNGQVERWKVGELKRQ